MKVYCVLKAQTKKIEKVLQRQVNEKIARKSIENPAKQIASRFDVYVNETESCMDCFVYSC